MTPEQQHELVHKHIEMVSHAVRRAMWRYRLSSDVRDELTSAANLGLIEASKSWDPDKGASFRNHAFTRIRGAILDEIARDARAAGRDVPLDRPLPDTASEFPNAERLLVAREDARRLNNSIDELPKAERKLVDAVYRKDLTLTEYAKKEGISKSWVSRLHDRALGILRNTEQPGSDRGR